MSMNEKTKKMMLDLIPFILLFIYFLIRFWNLKEPTADDITYTERYLSPIKSFSDLGDILLYRYNTWTSRLILECFILFFLKFDSCIWIVTISACFVGIAWLICAMFECSKRWMYWAACFAICFFPIDILGTAGYIVTSTVYIIPVFCAVFSMLPIFSSLRNEKRHMVICIVSVFTAIIAANHEQICAVLLGAYICYFLGCFIKHFKIEMSVAVAAVCALGSLLIHFVCVGNKARVAMETERWMEEFANWSILDKIIHGVCHTFDFAFVYSNIRWSVFVLIVFLAIEAVRNKSKFRMVISAFIIVTVTGLNILNHAFSGRYEFHFGFAFYHQFLSSRDYIYTLAELSVFIGVFILILACGDSRNLNILGGIIYLAGFGSSFILGFSPTVYVSLTRIFTFLVFAIISEIVLIISREGDRKKTVKMENE